MGQEILHLSGSGGLSPEFDADAFLKAAGHLRLKANLKAPGRGARLKRMVSTFGETGWGGQALVLIGPPEIVDALADVFPKSAQIARTVEDAVRMSDRTLGCDIVLFERGAAEKALYKEIAASLSVAGARGVRLHRFFSDIVANLIAGADPYIGALPKGVGDNGPRIYYAIICTGRSGSSFLCDLLTKTGLLGMPREHLRSPLVYGLKNGLIDLPDQMARLVLSGTTPNGVIGTKLISRYLLDVIGDMPISEIKARLPEMKVIHLQRRDKIAQAASIIRAEKTGRWHSIHSSTAPEGVEIALKDDDLDAAFETYRLNYERHQRLGELIDEAFEPNDVLRFAYEDVTADPEKYVRLAADHIGVGLPEGPLGVSSPHKKLPDNDNIYDRLKETLIARGVVTA